MGDAIKAAEPQEYLMNVLLPALKHWFVVKFWLYVGVPEQSALE